MTESTPEPTVGMLVRPRHKQDGYRTILEVKWKEETVEEVPNSVRRRCSVKFLLHADLAKKNGEPFMQTPWYPEEIFWNYWMLCES